MNGELFVSSRIVVIRRARRRVRDSNGSSLTNCVTTLKLRDLHFGDGQSAIDAAGSKRSEVSPVRWVLRLFGNWLGVRDDFRNWMVTAVEFGNAR